MKMLPVLEEVDQSRFPVKVEQFKSPKTSQVLSDEFDSVPICTMMELTPTSATLTPPQSPPAGETPMLTTLKPLVATAPMFQLFQNGQTSTDIVPEKLIDNVLIYRDVDYPELVTPQPDIAHELAVVDELVRSRVENMQWSSSGPSSPCSNSSSNSSFDDSCSSSDPEWVPEAVENLNESPDKIKSPTRKRSKPYSRSVDDKKSRKKEQNKNAATRYRMKKKAEVEVILGEEKQLIQEGEKFTNQITDIQREIKYLKGLMRDLFKAKGLIS
ncbi:hypothetical protein WA026_022737 [Henosepilachna vigintioctopunctata]|uniref:BZIP domain-containing protein n=1 Tax=Henosepilachna vigintioctopunctata TaxID=420089 RepID=A0AAW1UGD8_9CUCU